MTISNRTTTSSAPSANAVGTVGRETDRQVRVLRFWRSIEYFSAQNVKESDADARQVKDAGESDRRYDVSRKEPAPWEAGHPLRRVDLAPGKTWRYVLYGGVLSLDRLYRTLADVFGEDGRDVDERTPRGDSALFAVAASPAGRLLLDSLTISQAAWALGRTLVPGPAATNWLEGFDKATAGIGSRMAARIQTWDDDQAKALRARGQRVPAEGWPVSAALVHDLVTMVADALGVAAVLTPDDVLVRADPVDVRYVDQQQDTDFLNNFVADDLVRVATAAADGEVGAALASYLAEQPDESAWFDVRDPANLDVVLDLLAPENVPAGRWPADPMHSLVTSQQLAVNRIRARLRDGAGLFGVNGPPGTGKTTMLRDLVAATVVDRADQLAALASPRDAFVPGEWTGWDIGSKRIRFPRLRPELTGFEIVVASSNNGAVENVSRELPDLHSIAEPWLDADYLREHATRLLNVGYKGPAEAAPQAWGLLAATLGNKKNRGTFVNHLWFTPKDKKNANTAPEGSGLMDWLVEQHNQTGPASWAEAVKAFQEAVAAEATIRAERQRAHDTLQAVPGLTAAHEKAEDAVRQAKSVLDSAAAVVGPARTAHDQATKVAETARDRRREHRQARPPWWEAMFTFGTASRRWHTEDEALAARQHDAEATEEQTRITYQAAQDAADQAEWAFDAAITAERDAKDALGSALAVVGAVTGSMTGKDPSPHVPDNFWRSDEGRRERHAPWADPSWNEARTNLFLAALDLHDAFLVRSGKHGRALLGAAMDVIRGAPRTAPADAVLAGWQGLFLLAPVASTTFASVARMLSDVGAEAFGWLLIDEAGQATPQAAAGAIWRAQRVVAVGDPLQLEPVITALHTTQARLRDHHHVTDTWLPDKQSVQTLTDRVTPLGTHLHRDGEPLWVGAPLRVHRRCDEPMFSVINDAAYDGLMLHGAPSRADALGVLDRTAKERTPPVLNRPVRETTWIDVRGEADDNWIPAEGKAATWVVRGLMNKHGLRADDILVVSPFRAAADRLCHLVRREFGPGLTCGTVHVSQGKEAPAVILVLGGGTQGARSWAASRPNLMNVAVSRAKHRLYVIGDLENWKGLPHFDVLAARLDVLEYGRTGVSKGRVE